VQCTARLVKALPGQICPTPYGFAPPYHSRASGGPKKPERRPAPHGDANRPDFILFRQPIGVLLPFLLSRSASVPECADILSFFYIFDSLPDSPPPAAIGRTGRQAETALSLSVRSPCTTGLRFEAGPWGGMRLSSRESLPPQKFISHMDFSFFHSVKLILFLTVSFQR